MSWHRLEQPLTLSQLKGRAAYPCHLTFGQQAAKARGFTLIEVLFSLAFFMLGLYGIVGLQMAVFGASRRSSDVAMATSLVSGIVEELFVEDVAALLLQEEVARTRYFDQFGVQTDKDHALYTITWNKADADESTVYHELVVTARWLNPGEQQRIVKDKWEGHEVSLTARVVRRDTT